MPSYAHGMQVIKYDKKAAELKAQAARKRSIQLERIGTVPRGSDKKGGGLAGAGSIGAGGMLGGGGGGMGRVAGAGGRERREAAAISAGGLNLEGDNGEEPDVYVKLLIDDDIDEVSRIGGFVWCVCM